MKKIIQPSGKTVFCFLGLMIVSVLMVNSFANAQYVKLSEGEPGITVNVLQTNATSTTIEYVLHGYYKKDLNINGINCEYIQAPNMIKHMERGFPELPTYRRSIIIPDRSSMSYRVLEQDFIEVDSKPVMPSKGHFTRDIDPATVSYVFDNFYNTNSWFPENNIKLDEPYIVRDFRGMTVQVNPFQYNPSLKKLKIYSRIVVEVFEDPGKNVVNPFMRSYPLTKVSSEFSDIYRTLFMNYGMNNLRYDSIPEPGRLLIIYPAIYSSAIVPFYQWKVQRGLTTVLAEYPTQTGSGANAIKTYIQNMYNSPGSVTYIVLVGESNQIPTLFGNYEGAASDPCYVKLAGTDAYPDAFISRISTQNVNSLNYVLTKLIKYEKEPQPGAPWYKKGTGVASNEGSPPDYTRAGWLRDTLMAHGFTHIDQIYAPTATKIMITNALNDGRSVLNYIGHGSGTSWGTTGYNVSDIHALANGYKNPFIIDVACLNGKFTLSECMEEAWLRAGDTANPKGAIGVYGASTNTAWVPPCDLQTHSIYLLANKYRKTTGGVSFHGVMYAMDLWGGSTGQGLRLMEQYNLFGDCSTLMTFGVPLGPSIIHTPLPNTENLAGPYIVNCEIIPTNSGINPGKTRLFWTRSTTFSDSILMTKTTGNNWTANIPGNNSPAVYRYYIKTADSLNRIVTSPIGAPTSYNSFNANTDTVKPVITHSPLSDQPKNVWPATVNAQVTDNIGVESVWVKWYINSPSTVHQFNLNNTSGNNYSAPFNSDTSQVQYNDVIYYRVFAKDNSSAQNIDSTALYNFTIIAQTTACIGSGSTSVSYPFYTYYEDSKTDMIYTASEIIADGGSAGNITKIAFDVISAAPQTMNGFQIKMQHTTATSLSGFVTSGWTTVCTGTCSITGTGLVYIPLTTPFQWNGTDNLLIEICFDNNDWTANSTVKGTSAPGKTWHRHLDNNSGCTLTGGSAQTNRPNICLEINMLTGTQNISSIIPKEFSLEQNYPNPFNPVTKIQYSIAKTSLAKLKIFDILGREVMVLVNEVLTPGVYIADFNGSNLSSGIYYYRLEAGDFVNVKKMVLIK
jgi:hypothetical protein